MATVQVVYTWPGGGQLVTTVRASAKNVEALADMRIEAKRLFAESLASLVAVDAIDEQAVPDGLVE
jgi:hypothetical protein